MALARLTSTRAGAPTAGVTLVVYAPYGTDPELTDYPDRTATTIEQHPLVQNLARVARCGVHVCALVDLVDETTWLVEFTANKTTPRYSSTWKQQLDSRFPLHGLIRHACESRPGTMLVLGLEGHGAGYLPEIDRQVLTADQVTDNGRFEWRIGQESGSLLLPMGSPLLPMGSPLLPMGSPLLPSDTMPLSTWALGQALRAGLEGQSNRIGVILFNNCFNMAVEVLHTVAPLAEYAGGFANYNFFTAGDAYPVAFGQLQANGATASTRQLARWLVEANGRELREKTQHPTVGCVVPLSRMSRIANGVDELAKALITALTGSGDPAQQREVAHKIRTVIRRAQQYDTHSPIRLEAPDELTDLGSLAHELADFDVNAAAVQAAALKLGDALKGIKVYGDSGHPWVAPQVYWDFSRPELSMSIFCPDPDLIGLWDWRSAFYLQPDADQRQPAVQPHVIDFLKQTAWVPFIIEFHRYEPFTGLRSARIPASPHFNRQIAPT